MQLDEAQILAFNTLKEKLCEEPVLILPDINKPFEIGTDASQYAIGGVLFQRDKAGEQRPVAFTSRVLSKTEQNYGASEREMLAIQYCIQTWRVYVWGTKFKVQTDHSPLRGIKTHKDASRRLTRLILKLQDYDFDLYYTPGRMHIVPDAMSRNPVANFRQNINPIAIIQNNYAGLIESMQEVNIETMKEKEKVDDTKENEMIDNHSLCTISMAYEQPAIRAIKKCSTHKTTKKDIKRAAAIVANINKQYVPFKIQDTEIAKMQLEDESLTDCIQAAQKDTKATTWMIHNDCLHHIQKQRRTRNTRIQLVLPKSLREQIMEAYHDELLAGHCGYFKTAQKIQQWYWWPKMHLDIEKWVKECPTCQQHNRNYNKIAGKLAPIMAERPFQIIGMDILTDLPKTNRGNIAIVLFTDYYTKWVEAFALTDYTAVQVASKLITGIVCRHGAPERIISDRGSQFTTDVFRELTEMLGVKQSLTASYSPQADGQAEKAIGTLHQTLSKLVSSNQQDWDLMIPYALWAYRTAVHATTQETPYFLIYGREPTNPVDVTIRQWVEGHKNIKEYTETVAQRLLKARDRVIDATIKMKKRNKKRFDKDKIENPFKKNDIVWKKLERAKPTDNRKLSPKYDGPWIITEMIEDGHNLNVDITHTNNPNLIERTSIRKLKLAYLRPQHLQMIKDKESSTNTKEHKEIKKQEQKNSNEDIVIIPQRVFNKPVKNLKGKTVQAQKKRAGNLELIQDDRQEFEVESIVDERTNRKKNRKEYLIKWKGYTASYNTWEPKNNLNNAIKLLNEWNQRRKINLANKKKMNE